MDTKSLKNIPSGAVVELEHGRVDMLEHNELDIFFDVDIPIGGPFHVNVAAQIPMRPSSIHITDNDSLVVGDFIVGLCVQKHGRYDTAQTGQWLSFVVTNRSKKTQRFKARVRAHVGRF